MKKIRVQHSGIFPLQTYNDFPDGNLSIVEGTKNLPISIKRVYFINNLFNKKAVRGQHAHKKTEQFICCLSGSFTLDLDDGKTKQSFTIDSSDYFIRLGAMLWHTMRNFSPNCVLLVVANDFYKKSDYIRNYDEFTFIVKKKKSDKK